MKTELPRHTFTTYGELQAFCKTNGYSYRKAGHEDDGLNNGMLLMNSDTRETVGFWAVTG